MKKEVKNQINSFQALADLTMNPVFITALMYVRRTGNTLTLNGLGLEQQSQEELSFNQQSSKRSRKNKTPKEANEVHCMEKRSNQSGLRLSDDEQWKKKLKDQF